MKGVDVQSELQSLLTLTTSPSAEVRGYLSSKLRTGHFGFEATQPLFIFIVEAMSRTGAIPSIQMLASMPGVPQTGLHTLAAFASNNRPIASEDDAKFLVGNLDTYRKARLLETHLNATLAEVKAEVADFKKVQDSVEKLLIGLTDTEDDTPLWHLGEGSNIIDLYDKVTSSDRPRGIKTGFKYFDDTAGGFEYGNFNMLASHFKGGKSMLAYRMALNMYELGYNVLYLPLEMSDVETFQRHLSSISGVEMEKIRKQTMSAFESKQLMKSMAVWEAKSGSNKNRFSFQAISSLTPSQVQARYKAFNYDVIFLDYINLMEMDGVKPSMSDPERLNLIGRKLKQIAASMHVVLIGLTQIDIESGKVRYSRSFYEHCNNMWEWKYGDAERQTHTIEVKQSVARSWEPFSFKLKVDYQRVMVEDAVDTGFSPVNEFSADVGMEDMFHT